MKPTGNGRRRSRERSPDAANIMPANSQPAAAPAVLRGRPPEVSTESLLLPLYGTIGNPAGWAGFLDSLSLAYGGSMSCITSYDFANRTGFYDASIGAEQEFETSYVRHYARLNPWMGVLERLPVGLATLSDNILPYADLQRTEFYNDWCRPQRVGGGVGGFVERNGRRVVAATILMPRPVIDQDPAVLSRLETLMPHLLWVSRLHRQFKTLEARAAAAESAIDRLATAMLLLDAAGRVVYLNAQAERIVAIAEGLCLRFGTLALLRPEENDRLRRFIAAATRGADGTDQMPGGVMQVSRPSGRPAFELLVAPISDTVTRLGLRGRLVAVFVRDPELSYVTPAASLRQAFNLTGAEGRLMQALLAGSTMEEAGERFAVKVSTVRTQLKSLFQKTGATSQSDLVRIGLRSLTARYGNER